MLLQYFDNAEQDNGFTEHKGAKLFKVICEFKYIYSSKNPNGLQACKNKSEELNAWRLFFLAVSKLSLPCLHMLRKKEMSSEEREEIFLKIASQERVHTTNNFIINPQNI